MSAEVAVPLAAGEQLLTLKQVAKRLGCSVRTVSRRIERGELIAFRDRRLVRVRESYLEAYVAVRMATPEMRRTSKPLARVEPAPAVASLFDLPDPLR